MPGRAFDDRGARDRADDRGDTQLFDAECRVEVVAITRRDLERIENATVQIVPVGDSRRAPRISRRVVLENGRSP
jgi:hypothetical protein